MATETRHPTVTWPGTALSAPYSPSERQQMSQLPQAEQWLLHCLKAELAAEIKLSGLAGTVQQTSERALPETEERGRAGELLPPLAPAAKKPHHSKLLYALVWGGEEMPGRFCYRLGKKGDMRDELAAWRDRMKQQGWKTMTTHNGYLAVSPSGERRVAVIHEYDKVTKERLS